MKHHPLFDRRGYSLVEILVVVGLIGVVAAIAIPMMGNMLGFFSLSGDVRGVSNSIAAAKMRAASEFTRVRLYVNLDNDIKSYHTEVWDKTTLTWTVAGGCPRSGPEARACTTVLSSNVRFSKEALTTPPPNTQTTIGQAAKCTDDASPPVEIDHTACIMFNSRRVPINSAFTSTGDDALYLTDGTAVYGITVAATGMIRSWRNPPAEWVGQ